MERDMITLSADTSSDKFSIAVLDKYSIISRFRSTTANRQSSDMLPEIKRLLARSSLDIKDIRLFCIGLGPGSFTGLRIGITIMKSMAFVLKKPLIGIPSIDAIAFNAPQDTKDICVIIDARQNKLYVRFYKRKNGSLRSSGRIMLLGINEVIAKAGSTELFLGDGIKPYRDSILKAGFSQDSIAHEQMWYPAAEAIGKLGINKFKTKGRDNVFTLAPLYIYPKECQVIKKKKSIQ
jgi:tRNA threonylcarbamoyladenosine biosynthesis protein TsaB